MTLDFSGRPELFDRLNQQAWIEIRQVENLAIFLIRQGLGPEARRADV